MFFIVPFRDDSSCKHVVALLFAVERYTASLTDHNMEVCTDTPAYWAKPHRESQPVRVADLDYRHDKTKPLKPGPTPDKYRPLKSLNNDGVLSIRSKLQDVCHRVYPGALFLTTVDPPPSRPSPPTIKGVVERFKQSGETDIVKYMAKYTTANHVRYLAHLNQEDTEWLDCREARLTASISDEIRSLKESSTAKSLIDKVLRSGSPVTHANFDHGKIYESIARQLYESQLSPKHKQFICETTGLHILKSVPFIGAFVDGLVSYKCHGK